MRHWPFIGPLAILAAMLAPAALQSAPWPFTVGLALATAAPLLFIAHRVFFAATRSLRYHPLGVSVVSGLGCVMTLVGQYRYGRHDWISWCAAAALVVWMVWQRRARGERIEQTQEESDQ